MYSKQTDTLHYKLLIGWFVVNQQICDVVQNEQKVWYGGLKCFDGRFYCTVILTPHWKLFGPPCFTVVRFIMLFIENCSLLHNGYLLGIYLFCYIVISSHETDESYRIPPLYSLLKLWLFQNSHSYTPPGMLTFVYISGQVFTYVSLILCCRASRSSLWMSE